MDIELPKKLAPKDRPTMKPPAPVTGKISNSPQGEVAKVKAKGELKAAKPGKGAKGQPATKGGEVLLERQTLKPSVEPPSKKSPKAAELAPSTAPVSGKPVMQSKNSPPKSVLSQEVSKENISVTKSAVSAKDAKKDTATAKRTPAAATAPESSPALGGRTVNRDQQGTLLEMSTKEVLEEGPVKKVITMEKKSKPAEGGGRQTIVITTEETEEIVKKGHSARGGRAISPPSSPTNMEKPISPAPPPKLPSAILTPKEPIAKTQDKSVARPPQISVSPSAPKRQLPSGVEPTKRAEPPKVISRAPEAPKEVEPLSSPAPRDLATQKSEALKSFEAKKSEPTSFTMAGQNSLERQELARAQSQLDETKRKISTEKKKEKKPNTLESGFPQPTRGLTKVERYSCSCKLPPHQRRKCPVCLSLSFDDCPLLP